MFVEAHTVPSATVLEADLCIVGGGVAGLTLAAALAGSGQRILLLESGPAPGPPPAATGGSRARNVGLPYDQLDQATHRQLGGCSNLWNIDLGEGEQGPRLQPLMPIDFEERDWVSGSGWPFGREHLQAYYAKARSLMGLPHLAEDDLHPGGGNDELLRFHSGAVESTLFQFLDRRVYTERIPAQLEKAQEVQVLLGATVTEVLPVSTDSLEIDSVRVTASPGHHFTVRARKFVLAAGAVENARLLLASRSLHPAGLGNRHDLVGRYFTEHPHFCAGWLVPRDSRLLSRLGLYEVHRSEGKPQMVKLRLSEEVMRRERLQGFCVAIVPRWRALATKGVRALLNLRAGQGSAAANLSTAAGDAAGIARFAVGRLRERTLGRGQPNVLKLNAMTEQTPNPASRVTLAEERDEFGVPLASLDWQLAPADIDGIRRAQEILEREFARSRIGTLVVEDEGEGLPSDLQGGWHHMGTTRMHADPRRGVVDPDSRVHGSPNLFIAGPSVFPTGGYANPVLTIVALTLRLAQHLQE